VLFEDNVTHVLLLRILTTKRIIRLLVRQEIGRKSREIIRPCIRVALSSRSIEFEHDNRATPSFRSRARGDVVDCSVNGRAAR